MYGKKKILEKRSGLAPIGILSCRECESKLKGKNEYVTYDYEEVVEFPWALMISCPDNNHKSFYICTECNNKKARMTTRKQLLRHKYRYHRKSCKSCPSSKNASPQKKRYTTETRIEEERETEPGNIINSMDDTTISFTDKDSIEDEMHNIEKYPLEKQDLYFNTEKSNNFFLEETAGFGNAYLCGYSHFHLKNISNKLDEDEVELDMKIAYLSLQLSVDQRKLFSEIIDGIIEKERKKFVAKDESFDKTMKKRII